MKHIIKLSFFMLFIVTSCSKPNNNDQEKEKKSELNKIQAEKKNIVAENIDKFANVEKANIIKEKSVLNLENAKKPKELKWNEETVRTYINSIKSPNRYKYVDNRIINIITNAAIINNINVPTNIIDFTQFILEFPSTNDNNICRILDIIDVCTNEILGEFLLAQFTNYYNEKYILPGWQNPINRSSACLGALLNIGTPELIDKLNKTLEKLNKNNRRYTGPGATISPDRFPKESEDWLFNSPYRMTREIMATRWLESKRPERVDVLRKYIKKLEDTDKMDPYFTYGGLKEEKPYLKKIVINQLKDRVDNIENSIKSSKKNSKDTERAKRPMVPKALRRLNHR